MNSDILIIGGGVIGLSIARELRKKGARKITLIEKGKCGQESSWAAAGMLGPQVEADEGSEFFDMACGSRDLFPSFADELLDETGIDIELDRSGTLYLALRDEDAVRLKKRFEWQNQAGFQIEQLSADEVRKLEPLLSPNMSGALFFPNDWQVDNRKLVNALRLYAEANGISIIESCEVKSLILDEDRVTGALTDNGTFNTDVTVLATGAWTSLIKLGPAAMPIDVKPVRGQMIAFKPNCRILRHITYSFDGYVVPKWDGRILAGSTIEHIGFDKSVTAEAATHLHKMAAAIVPRIAEMVIADHWSGLRPYAREGLPIMGNITGIENVFVATAHYRNGILLAPITARLIAQRILDGIDATYLKTFAPKGL